MLSLLRVILCLMLCLLKTKSVSIKGPPLPRYDPCGLGVVHFDRLAEYSWQGVVYLEFYPNLVEVEIGLKFEEPVEIHEVNQNATLVITDNWRNFVIKPKGPLPKTYIFMLSTNKSLGFEREAPVVREFSLNNIILCNDRIKASQTVASLNVTGDTDHQYKHICGRRSLDHTELVTVRTEAEAGDWPWHVAIMVQDTPTGVLKYECGGNIISRTTIITAAHCVFKNGVLIDSSNIIVIAGTNNYKDGEQLSRQIFKAEKVIPHPSYVEGQATSDLAVIKVNRLIYTKYVQPICIWGPVYDKSTLFGVQATIVGFGTTENNLPSQVLRSTYIQVQNDSTCIAFQPNLYENLLNEFTFCAGYGPTSRINPRNGDSGGGLIIATTQPDHKISYFLRGVLSKCGITPPNMQCDPKYYVVYTDVGPHYGWLYHHSGLYFSNNIV